MTTTENETPLKAPALPFKMKANLAEYRRRIGIGLVLVGVALSLIVYVRSGVIAWLCVLAASALLITVIMYMISRRTITATDTGVEHVNMFGIRHFLLYSDVKSVKVFLEHVEANFGSAPKVIIGKKNGKPFTSMSGIIWKPEEIDLLLAALANKDVVVEYYDGAVTSLSIAKQFPEFATPYEKHPYMWSFAIAFAILIAVAAGVVLFYKG